MGTKNYQAKRQYIKEEKRLEKKHCRILVGLAIFACSYYYFFEPKTIGHDIRYNIFIFWLPTLIGTIVIGIHRRQFLMNKFATNKGFGLWSFMIAFYLIQGFIFSYLSFGQVAKISSDIINRQRANENPNESLVCNVTRFWSKKSKSGNYSIEFKFNDKYERMKVSYQTIKKYIEENPKDYEITIQAQKGLWDHYFVNDWTIQKK